MKIIESGRVMEGIPYPVAVWDAKHDFWDDSIVELSGVFANSEEEAIDLAKDYILEFVYELDDEEEREREIKYYSDDGNYTIDSDRHALHLFVFETYTDKGGTGTLALYTDDREAVRAAKDAWEALCEHDKNEYRRDVVGTFRVYAVSIPYADIIGEGEDAYIEKPYTEYEEFEEWNVLKYEEWYARKED